MPSCAILASAYYGGQGVERDLNRYTQLNDRACQGGFAPACYSLGDGFRAGVDVPADPPRSVRYYARANELATNACDRGDLRSCLYLGVAYAYGRGMPVDRDRAHSLFVRACDGGDSYACDMLANEYRDGIGVARNRARAALLYARACRLESTNLDACYWVREGLH